MSKGSAKQFIELIEKEVELQDEVRNLNPGQIVALAKEKGFEVTFEELEEAIKETRRERKQCLTEMNLEEMDKVAGGVFWVTEDASDGHELYCVIAYHDEGWMKEHGEYCSKWWYSQTELHYNEVLCEKKHGVVKKG